jgi:coenzyme F420 hydrogenase subunit beta
VTDFNPKYQTPEGKPLKPVQKTDPFLSIAFTHKELCTRCGSCSGVCPTKAITIGEDKYPQLNPDLCTACGLCGEVCPGGNVQYGELAEQVFGEPFVDIGFDGKVDATYVGYANDNDLRNGGSGGGLATALLAHLLKTGQVDGCLVTRMNREKPWKAEPFIATSMEELRKSQGSRYSIIPLNTLWTELREREGRFAAALLPCHTHGFRKLQKHEPELAEKISVVIGLFCGGALEPNMTTEMLAAKGISKEEISDFQFRGGKWPGQMCVTFKDGRPPRPLHYSNYKEGAYIYFASLYLPERCQTCLDGSNEFADIAVSDAWTRDEKGNYKFEAHSKLLVRTAKGAEVIKSALASGDLTLVEVTSDPSYQTHKIQTKRKGVITPIRIERWKKAGRPVPVYDRTVPPDVTVKERISELLVTSVMRAGRNRRFRMALTWFLTSRYSIPLIKLRMMIKKRKYRK